MNSVYLLHEDGILLTTYESVITLACKSSGQSRREIHEYLSKRRGIISCILGNMVVNLKKGHKIGLSESCKEALLEAKEDTTYKIKKGFVVNPNFSLMIREQFDNELKRNS